MGLLCMYCNFWELAPLWVCADHTPNTLLNALRLRDIDRYKHRKTAKSGKPHGNCMEMPGKQPEQMWGKINTSFFPDSWVVLGTPVSPGQLGTHLSVVELQFCVFPLSLARNLSSSNNAACWESSGAFYTPIHGDVCSNEIHCVLNTFVLGHEVSSRNGEPSSSASKLSTYLTNPNQSAQSSQNYFVFYSV